LALSTTGVNGEGSGMGDWPVCATERLTAERRTAHPKVKNNRTRKTLVSGPRRAIESSMESLVVNCNLIRLTLKQSMQQVEKCYPYKNDNRDHGVSFFFVIHLGDKIAGGDIEGNAGREGKGIAHGTLDSSVQ